MPTLANLAQPQNFKLTYTTIMFMVFSVTWVIISVTLFLGVSYITLYWILYLVSSTLKVNPTFLIITCKKFWALEIYNVAIIITY